MAQVDLLIFTHIYRMEQLVTHCTAEGSCSWAGFVFELCTACSGLHSIGAAGMVWKTSLAADVPRHAGCVASGVRHCSFA